MVTYSKSQRTLSASLSLLSLSLLSLLSFTSAQSTSSFTPSTVWAAGTARTTTRFFILSGIPIASSDRLYPAIDQFFYLDLAVPWTSTAPAWVQLRPGPKMANFPGAVSANAKNLFFFRIPGSSPVYQFSIETGNWSPANAAFTVPNIEGLGPVTDPNTDLIYIAAGYSDAAHSFLDIWNWKTGQISNTVLPDITAAFADRTYYTSGWCKSRQSIMYWGGYSTAPRNNLVTELKPPGTWSTFQTTGTNPPMLADHCMAINDEGTKLVVHGGRLETNIFSSQIFILDIPSSTWTTGPAGAIPRAYMACTFAGDQFIAWGGVQTTSLITDGEVVIFDVPTSTWVKKYTPPASYQSLVVAAIPGAVGARPGSIPTASGGMPPAPSGSNGTIGGDKSSDSGSGSGVGGIVGGVVGGLVVICAIVVFLFYKRRKAQGQSQGNLYVKANTTPDGPSTTVAVSGYPPGHDHGHDRGNSRGTYDEPRPFIAASPDKSTAAVFSPVQNERNPHLFIPTLPDASEASAPVFSNQTYQSPQTIQDQVIGSSAYYQQMHEIENQRRQLELKRQLLILEEQGQQLRQAPQQQYQQQQMTQYPMPESVSAAASGYPIPTTAATVQLLPDATEPSTMAMGQYYMTAHSDNRESKSTFEPYHATPVIYLATGTSTSGGRSPQSTPTSG